MKKEFKIGDWVRSKGSEINSQNAELLVKQLKSQIQIDKFITPNIDEWELWTPKEGEWCWFYNSDNYDSKQLTLGKFIGKRSKSKELCYQYSDADKEIYASEYCEPFVYDLPTIIKG